LFSMNTLAWILATCPDPELRNPEMALTLAKRVTEQAQKNGDYWNTLGAAYYRVGDYKSAVAALNKSTDLRNGGDPTDWFFLAMARWRLGDKDKAHMLYDKAAEWMENHPHDEELLSFRDE